MGNLKYHGQCRSNGEGEVCKFRASGLLEKYEQPIKSENPFETGHKVEKYNVHITDTVAIFR
jgi:hypothetical protein